MMNPSENVRPSLPSQEETLALADLFKIFGDTTRIQIMFTLLESEKNVGQIADDLAMSQSAVSHQLQILRKSKLVRTRRQGKQVFYSLADEHVYTILKVGREHVDE